MSRLIQLLLGIAINCEHKDSEFRREREREGEGGGVARKEREWLGGKGSG